MTKMLSAVPCVPVRGSFDSWVEPNGPSEFAVVDPTLHHELILVFDIRIDEMKEHSALDAIVGLARIIGWPIGQSATTQPVRIVTAAGLALASDG